MDNERILRTSVFGGFKKDDVLQYVEELKQEISSMQEEMKEKLELLSSLNEQISTLTAICEAGKETEKELEKSKGEVAALEAENEHLRFENSAYAEQVAHFDIEKKQIEEKAEQVKLSEAQLGAAFLDARKYSDEIVTAANRKATDTQEDASNHIEAQAAEIAKLSTEVDSLSATLTKSISALHADIATLSLKLTKAAQSLKNRKDAEKFVPDISIKIEEELGEKITGVTETNDGTGLTFIQYPAKTDFNEDLNIKPDSIYRFDQSKEG